MITTFRDPTHQLLKAYTALLQGSIIYAGQAVPAGTRIPRKAPRYVYIYVESLENYSTGDKVLYKAIVAAQVVSIQNIAEGDEAITNEIMSQVFERVTDAQAIIMDDFSCLSAQPMDTEAANELYETTYNIVRKLRMLHFIEQTT